MDLVDLCDVEWEEADVLMLDEGGFFFGIAHGGDDVPTFFCKEDCCCFSETGGGSCNEDGLWHSLNLS